MKKVGILSGTFDPIHNGHLQFARDAMKHAKLDKIFFLVEPRPRRKQGVKAFEHRLQMVQLAVQDEPRFGTIELQQAQFTAFDTLPLLRARFVGATLYNLMGDDTLKRLGDWPPVEDMISTSHFVIGVREDKADALSYIKALEQTRGLDLKYHIFKSKFAGVSSSKVKESLREKDSASDIPPAVLNYIRKSGLYGSSALS